MKRINHRPVVSSPLSRSKMKEFYSGIYPPRYSELVEFFDCHHPSLDRDFTVREVLSVLNNLKNEKAPGPDGIPNEFYKWLP